jgi:hypothetical protein
MIVERSIVRWHKVKTSRALDLQMLNTQCLVSWNTLASCSRVSSVTLPAQ